jgi:hypothetical protein
MRPTSVDLGIYLDTSHLGSRHITYVRTQICAPQGRKKEPLASFSHPPQNRTETTYIEPVCITYLIF